MTGKSQTAPKPKRKPKTKTPALTRREPNNREAAAFPAAIEKHDTFCEPVRIRVEKQPNGFAAIDSRHTDLNGHSALLSVAFGSRSGEWLQHGMDRVALAIQPGINRDGQEIDETRLNAALAFMSGVAPENEVEAALAMQMLATHEASLDMIGRMRRADMLPQLEAYGALATKLSRTFAAQMEALHKIRRGGEQVVKYIHVHEGGQAVVAGTINQGGRANGKGGEQSYGATAIGAGAALPSPDPARDGVPFACDAERALSPARREESGGAEGQ